VETVVLLLILAGDRCEEELAERARFRFALGVGLGSCD
jgi:hypothetical protein